MQPEPGARKAVPPDFHFYAAPTVTAGFIAFAFDIRIETEVEVCKGVDSIHTVWRVQLGAGFRR
jgi:hypothetical protein